MDGSSIDCPEGPAPIPGVHPKGQSIPESGARLVVAGALTDFRKAERALAVVAQAAPDVERADGHGRHSGDSSSPAGEGHLGAAGLACRPVRRNASWSLAS